MHVAFGVNRTQRIDLTTVNNWPYLSNNPIYWYLNFTSEFRSRMCVFISANANTVHSMQWISTNARCVGLVCIALHCIVPILVVQLCNAFVNFVFRRISVPRILNRFLVSGKSKAMHCTQIEKSESLCVCAREKNVDFHSILTDAFSYHHCVFHGHFQQKNAILLIVEWLRSRAIL